MPAYKFASVYALTAWSLRRVGKMPIHSRYSYPPVGDLGAWGFHVARTATLSLLRLAELPRALVIAAMLGHPEDRTYVAGHLPDRHGGDAVPLELRRRVLDEWLGMGSVGCRDWQDALPGSHMRVQRYKLAAHEQLDTMLAEAMAQLEGMLPAEWLTARVASTMLQASLPMELPECRALP